ncbi:MAG: alpha/beta fold hydrolase [Pirellulales bacterium]
MIAELARVVTSDGLRLDGSLERPLGPVQPPLNADAVLCLHGTGGNFYSSALFDEVARWFTGLGLAVLRVNTRGRDLVWPGVRGKQRRLEGAAFETVDECRHDVAAWVGWLAERGFSRIAVVGHSLGAIKAVYSLAHETTPAVHCVAAISPPRLSHGHFKQSVRGAEFIRDYEAAQDLVSAGRPEELMRVSFPLPYLVSAAGFLDKYGPQERYNILKHVDRVRCPLLFTFGSVELEQVPFQRLPEDLSGLGLANAKVAVVAGADHFYTGVLDQLASRLETWLSE